MSTMNSLNFVDATNLLQQVGAKTPMPTFNPLPTIQYYIYGNDPASTVPANTAATGAPMFGRNDQIYNSTRQNDYSKFSVSLYTSSQGTLWIESSENPDSGYWTKVTTPVVVGSITTSLGTTTVTPGSTSITVPFHGFAYRAVFQAGAQPCSVRFTWGRTP